MNSNVFLAIVAIIVVLGIVGAQRAWGNDCVIEYYYVNGRTVTCMVCYYDTGIVTRQCW